MTNPYVPAKIGVVVLEPGFGDLSMADQVETGLLELGGDIVVDYEYFTAEDITEAGVIITQLSESGIYDLIIVIGGALADELNTIALEHPNQSTVVSEVYALRRMYTQLPLSNMREHFLQAF
jgi:basic membrane lipoprotein Med (substrate-binding protein (PBP1-ABC) superfamily)